MSRENVTLLMHLQDSLNRGDVAAFVEAFDPEGEVVDPPDMPGATSHRGHEGIRRFAESFTKFWAEWRTEAEEVTAVGDNRVFAQGQALGRGRASGVEVVRPFYVVANVENGRFVEVRFYGNRAEALEAAGLSE